MSLYIDANYESINKHKEELCGDKVEIIRSPDSVVVVLADGLGSGVKANILATLTSKIIGTIMSNGLDIDEAVNTIASTLPVCKERELAYSTFSIIQIFNDGQGYLVEFDNPSIIRLRKGRPLEISTESRIISGKLIHESRFTVCPDDLFVMISDGVIHAGIGKTLNLGWQWSNVCEYLQKTYRKDLSSKAITKLLISACDSLYSHQPGDDTTVVALKAKKPDKLSLMIGPPIDSTMDDVIVNRFIGMEGKKVVCGGTTSQIVSRVLGKEIKTSIEYFNPSIPPTAEIEGINLTTEGVLTLRNTLELLRTCTSPECSMNDFLKLNKKDGASKLAKVLLEESTSIYIFVGQAMNPAHQNPEFPLNMGLKFKLVEEIATLLKQAGKHISIEYC